MSLNSELSDLFSRFAALLELKGEPVFKTIAFNKVSRILKDMSADIRAHVEEGTLNKLEGVGASSRRIIEDYVRNGKSSDYEQVAESIPQGLLELLEIPSLGPKTIALFWKERNIESLDALKTALDDGSLEGLKGVGKKKLQSIREGIDLLASSAGRIGIWVAKAVAEAFLDDVRKIEGVVRAEYAGSLRRGKETIGDIDIIAECEKGTEVGVAKAFSELPHVNKVLVCGETKASVIAEGVQVDLRMVNADSYGACLMYFTGSKEHNVRMRQRAIDQGMKLNEWSLHKEDGAVVAGKTEAEIYEAMGLRYIEPQMREDRGEIPAAEADELPALITRADINGDLHSHTTASDGKHSIEQMANAAKSMGYKFLAITDHSKSQAIARGLDEERLLAHIEAIHHSNDKIKGITILAGSEVDILADGHLDYDDEILKQLDIVIASPHTALKQDTDKATKRLLMAIENRYVNIIGHPTGRMIGQREGLPLDFDRIFKEAADAGVALEINSGVPRLDLSDVRAKSAAEAGCLLSINTDAHAVEQFLAIDFGITVARRAWLASKQVVNCMSAAALKKWLRSRR